MFKIPKTGHLPNTALWHQISKTHLRPKPLLQSRCSRCNGSPRYTVQCSHHMGNLRPLANTCQCHSSRNLRSAQRNCEQRHYFLWWKENLYESIKWINSQIAKKHIFFFSISMYLPIHWIHWTTQLRQLRSAWGVIVGHPAGLLLRGANLWAVVLGAADPGGFNGPTISQELHGWS